jgi:hypothetical protein
MSIPASQIVSVTPSVLSAGGNPLAFNGLILSTAASLPTGAPTSFPTAASVETYFGAGSTEADMASVYFDGFDNSTMKPSALLFSRYASAAIAAFNRAGAHGLTLAELKDTSSIIGMTIVTDGTSAAITGVDLSGATSFSDAATLLSAALSGATKPTITYDATFGAFVATSGTTGVDSTIAYGAGDLATILKFTLATGATLSQGADATTPAVHMASVLPLNQNWVSFTSTFEPSLANKEAFATWTDGTGGRYMYACWDTDANAVATPGIANASFGQWLNANAPNGTTPVYSDATNGPLHAAFICGIVASIDFTEKEGRITLAFKSNSGLSAYVTDATIAANLLLNGYSYYGAYATANDSFVWLYNGQVSGDYGFADSYINACWLNNQLQLAMMTLFANTKSVPYNPLGYGFIRAAAQDPIDAALNFGAIRAGVPLSAAQVAQVNAAAGLAIDQTLSSRGWYFQVSAATAQVRALRQTPPCKLWYMDGESVQQLNIASIDIL